MSRSGQKSKNDRAGAGCLTAFGVIWMLMILVMDGFILSGFYKLAYAKSNYVQINATITQSSVQSQTSDDGTTYSADIEFVYTVADRPYTSDRHSFFNISTSSKEFAQQIADKYPVGAQIVAYYDPAKPEDAVIELNDASFPYAVVLFLTPFHCVGIGLVYGGASASRRKRQDPHAAKIAGYVIRKRGRTLILHDAFWPSWLIFLILLGVVNFVAVFVVLIGFGFSASKSTVVLIWMLSFAIAWFVPYFKSLKRSSSENRLTLNWEEGWFKRGDTDPSVPIANIVKIKLSTTGTNTKVNKQEWYKHTIQAIDLNDQSHALLVGKGPRHRGKELRNWFEIEFGLKEPSE